MPLIPVSPSIVFISSANPKSPSLKSFSFDTRIFSIFISLCTICFAWQYVRALYNVNYTWRFKGKALKDLSVPTFRRGVSSDQKIKKETLNLVVKRKVNNKEVEILYNDERGYNIRYLSFSTFELDLEVFVAQFLRKNDIFDIEISYTLVDNYNPQGDYFYIFPFTFDDAICKDLSIEIISNDCIITEALLEYVNEGTEMVDTKTMRKIGEKYSLMFNPSLENKAQGFYKISTDSDNN